MNRGNLSCAETGRGTSERQGAWGGTPAAASPEGSQDMAPACAPPCSLRWVDAQYRCALELESGCDSLAMFHLTLRE